VNGHRLAGWSAGAVVAAAVGTGLVLSGSPLEQRLEHRDGRRVDDLRELAGAIERYRERHDSLPSDLRSLLDGRIMSNLPEDPDGRPYEYARAAAGSYELCARFERESVALATDFWTHPGERHCFAFDAPTAEP